MLSLKQIKNIVYDTVQYGPCISISRFSFDSSKANGTVNPEALSKMHKAILRYLNVHYGYLCKKYAITQSVSSATQLTRNTIWLFWWQGMSNAPEVVKYCYKSIKDNHPDCSVIVIDKENYACYVNISKHIIDKLHSGYFSLTHFSDILRMNLLSQHGGVWLDATILCVTHLSPEFFELPFYTAKSNQLTTECIADYRWTCYAIAGNAGNVIFNFMSDFFDAYWAREHGLIHYFLIDYAMELGYRYIATMKKQLDSIPCNNVHRNELLLHLNEPFSEAFSLRSLQLQNSFYKLAWKKKFNTVNNGSQTVWKYLCDTINSEDSCAK